MFRRLAKAGAAKSALVAQRSFLSRRAPAPLSRLQDEVRGGRGKKLKFAQEWFDKIDTDGTRELEFDQMQQLMTELDFEVSNEEMEEIFNFFDRERMGVVNYDVFMNALKGELPVYSSSIDLGGSIRNVMPSAMRSLQSSLPQFDIAETSEWMESLDAVVQVHGPARARYLLHDLLRHAQQLDIPIREPVITPFANTIARANEEAYPGNSELEERITNLIRWNAVAMVSDANHRDGSLGGHIGTFASMADMWEVLQNHFFRGKNYGGGEGDSIYIQGHASPGAYSRAFLEGRLTRDQLMNFRKETGGKGLSSYPHPRLMPTFWENPTVSMGIGPLQAVHQARYYRYLHMRGLADTSKSRVWAFIGDGEMDESETISAIAVAGRERLNNLVFIINCNYQRLDGPVRGNSKVIQEFEGLFRGAGWDCIKLAWGKEWNDLIENDFDGKLVDHLENHPDGDCQRLAALNDGAKIREELFPGELADRVKHLNDDQLRDAYMLPGGHCREKIYSAFARAEKNGEEGARPTVILAKTLKGFKLSTFVGRNPVHQKKKLNDEEMLNLRTELGINLSDEQVLAKDENVFCLPSEDSEEITYLKGRREKLGGYLPSRSPVKISEMIRIPGDELYEKFYTGTKPGKKVSTTIAWGGMLRALMKVDGFGKRVVPILTDESRTFGLESFFPEFKIHAPFGQSYTPVDAGSMLNYAEAPEGQLLQEGISEAGALCTWIAAGTSYASQGTPTLPFFIYYSMFGFQRVGDFIWQAADMRVRGFLLGGTAGRTTLNGEGLQHQDGHSLLIALTNPGCRAWDPAFGYEVAIIIRDGIREMWGEDKDVFYYMMLYNEDIEQPSLLAEDKERVEAGIKKGMYHFKTFGSHDKKVRLLGSGVIMQQVLDAAKILDEKYGVSSEVWSVVSYGELHNDMHNAHRMSRLNPDQEETKSFVAESFAGGPDITIACSDYQKALPETIRADVPGYFDILGTDGFGRSDTRENLRRFFEIDHESVVACVLSALSRNGDIEASVAVNAIKEMGLIQGKRTDITAI
ncbi:Pyruvate dehydrogenase E1 component [Diplonema papillatum]|nr:Pyruvate dehydrogenase E1 component [Diplonema papillatum]